MAKPATKPERQDQARYDFAPRAQLLMGDSLRRYSSAVQKMKYILPALALGVLLALMIWPQLFGSDNHFTLNSDQALQQAPQSSVIMGPRYVGNNGRGLRYNIQAATAKPAPDQPQAVNLDRLRIESQSDDKAMRLVADRATYWRDRNGLAAQGNIELVTTAGQTIQTDQAYADFKAGTIWGNAPISGESAQGNFQGQGFEAAQNGNYFKLSGKVKLSLQPRTGS